MKRQAGGVAIVGIAEDGAVSPAPPEIEDVAFDPTKATLELTKEEKRRTTALLLAIQAYDKLIIKDAEYLKEMHNEARRDNGPVIREATMDAMVSAAIQFDLFIAGHFNMAAKEIAAELNSPNQAKGTE